jgi:hypothetical protein
VTATLPLSLINEIHIRSNQPVPFVLYLLQIIGASLIIQGFYLWNSKHQKYIDAEIKWKGEVFIALLKDEKAKKKAIQDELQKVKNDSDTTSSET